jgi:hypothetical protein
MFRAGVGVKEKIGGIGQMGYYCIFACMMVEEDENNLEEK